MTSESGVTKASLRARCQQILSHSSGRVGEEDALFLLTEVLPRHPDWTEKAGPGVSHIEIRVHGEYRTKGFFLVRTDGLAVDISYRVALDGVRNTDRFRSAARFEIFGQISTWRRLNPAPHEGMHVDHVEPFDSIVRDWLTAIGLSQEEIGVTSQRVGHHDLFASRDLALSWQRFHRGRARYQWLDAAVNIAKSNAKPPPDPVSPVDPWLQAYEAQERKERAA